MAGMSEWLASLGSSDAAVPGALATTQDAAATAQATGLPLTGAGLASAAGAAGGGGNMQNYAQMANLVTQLLTPRPGRSFGGSFIGGAGSATGRTMPLALGVAPDKEESPIVRYLALARMLHG